MPPRRATPPTPRRWQPMLRWRLAKVETRKVRPDSMVVYQNNRYGPLGDDLIGETVQLRATLQKLNIYRGDRLIASYMLNEDETGQDEE